MSSVVSSRHGGQRCRRHHPPTVSAGPGDRRRNPKSGVVTSCHSLLMRLNTFTQIQGDVSSIDDDSIPPIEYEELLANSYGVSSYTDTEHLSGVEEEEYWEKTKKEKKAHYSAKG